MSVPKKKAVVSKKITDQQIQDSKKWQEFVYQCQVQWDNMEENWKDFFYVIGDSTQCNSEEINAAIDKAMTKNLEKV
jgi:hypothetical protein